MKYIFLLASVLLLLLLLIVVLLLIWSRSKKKRLELATLFENPEMIQSELIDKATTLCDKVPPCGPGFVQNTNKDGDVCCYPNLVTEGLSDAEMVLFMGEILGTSIIGGLVMDRIVKHLGKKLITRTGAKVSFKVTSAFVKPAFRTSIVLGAKVTSKATFAALKASMGPVGWAMLVFDVLSMALDLWDPFDYDSWQSNTVWKSVRNKAEIQFESTVRNNGQKYPVLAPYLYDPDKQLEIMSVSLMVQEVIEHQMNLLIDKYIERYGEPNDENVVSDDKLDLLNNEVKEEMERLIDSGHFEKYICRDLRIAGFPVEWHEELEACSLNRTGCEEFNRFQVYNLPKDERAYAVYTREYREADPREETPTVITRKLEQPACLMSPLMENADTCKKESHGSTWNEHAGMCDFSKAHCDRYGMKHYKMEDIEGHDIHNCQLYPGQSIAEFVFGSTITKTTIRGFVSAQEALYLDKIRELGEKYIPMFDVLTFQLQRDLMIQSVEMTLEFAKHMTIDLAKKAVRDVSRFGRRAFKDIHSIITNPRVIFEDPMIIIDIIGDGLKMVVGLIKHVLFDGAKMIFRHIMNQLEQIGESILDGFRTIGKIKDIF
mgnify:CR=1 FL=1